MRTERLKHVAAIRVSNVDKKSADSDLPVRLCNYTDVYYNEQITSDLSFMPATATKDQHSTFGLRAGDVVLTKDSETADDIGVSALIAEDVPDLVCGYHLAVVRAREETAYGPYLRWVLASDPARQAMSMAATGVTRFGLRSEAIADLGVPMRPLEEQRAIAGYLDRETARIDALIAAKQRMVVVLKERASELVADRLLGPPVPGAGPGEQQVAPRPGWTTTPFRWLFREIDQRSTTGQEVLLSVSQTRGVIPQTELGDRRQYAETLIGYKLCRPGDLVVNRMWVYYGALGSSRHGGLVSPDYAVFRPVGGVSSEFAAYVLRTPAYVAEMTRLVRGIGAAFQGAVRKPRLHPSELGLIGMPVPPALDQARILEQLDADMQRLGVQASLLERSVALLRERRQALITAAVTGQIEVPVAA